MGGLLAALWFVSSCGLAQATDYYVSTTGNDAADGRSAANAVATIRVAVDRAVAGDTVWVLPGTYHQGLNIWEKNGTAAAWITVSGLPGEARPLIDLSGIPSGILWIGGNGAGSSYVHLRRLAVANSPDSHGIGAVNVHNLTIEDCESYGHYMNGIHIGHADGVTNDHIRILNNYVHHNVRMNLNGVHEASRLWSQGIVLTTTVDSEVIGNTVQENWGEGIGLLGTTQYSGRNLVQGNRAYDNWSVQIYVDHASDNIIQGNFTWSSLPAYYREGGGAKGLAVADEAGDPALMSTGNIFRNNVVVGALQGFRWGNFGLKLGMKNTQVVNNTFANFTNAGIRIDAATAGFHSNNFIADNIFIAPAAPGVAAAFVTDVAGNTFSHNLWWGPSGGRINGVGDVLADPRLVGCAGSQQDPTCYQPGVGSAARAAGIAVVGVNLDFAGTTRPGTPTLGAYEYRLGTTAIALGLGSPSVVVGSAASLTATLTGSGGVTPTGSVSFLVNGVVVGSGTLTGSGGSATATYALSGLTPGVYPITASYGGDANLAGATSAAALLTVSSGGGARHAPGDSSPGARGAGADCAAPAGLGCLESAFPNPGAFPGSGLTETRVSPFPGEGEGQLRQVAGGLLHQAADQGQVGAGSHGGRRGLGLRGGKASFARTAGQFVDRGAVGAGHPFPGGGFPGNGDDGPTGQTDPQGNALVAVPHHGAQVRAIHEAEETLPQGAIELPPQVFPHNGGDPLHGHARPVGAGAGHGVKGIAQADDAGGLGNGPGRKALGVAPAIRRFVVHVHRIQDPGGQGVAGQHAAPHFRVGFDDIVFLPGEAVGLAQNGVRHPHLAQVVEKAPQGDAGGFPRGQTGLFRKQSGKPGDPPEMPTRVGVPGLHHPGHGEQAGEEGF